MAISNLAVNADGHGLVRNLFLSALILVTASCLAAESLDAKAGLFIHPTVLDSAGDPLDGATIVPYLYGRPVIQADHGSNSRNAHSSGENGLFVIEIAAPIEKIAKADWALKITEPSDKPSQLGPPAKIMDEGAPGGSDPRKLAASTKVNSERSIGTPFFIALAVLITVYILIFLEVVHRTLAALLGAAFILLVTHTLGTYDDAYKVLTYHQALRAVDWNVIFLLMGMMVIVGVLKVSGVFQWLAYKSFQVTRGRIFLLVAALCVVTAIASAFLDNVTTMLLLTPVTLEIALILRISPFVLLMPEILASNFGGTATLIGDPPNIMIGSYAGLTFNDFMLNLTPVVVTVVIVHIIYNKIYYRRNYADAKVEDVPSTIAFLSEKYRITDPRILTVGGLILVCVILLFVLHGFFHMEVSVAALFGAALMVLLTRSDIVRILEHEIEWPSLVFFIMLFIVVGAAEQTGILQFVADWILRVCHGNLTIAVLMILWVSGVTSAIVDNIPFTATMLPIVAFLSKTLPDGESGVLWWALALGACFGGNGTVIGASANVVTVGIAERLGYHITFYEFLKQAAPITVISLIISSIFLLIRY